MLKHGDVGSGGGEGGDGDVVVEYGGDVGGEVVLGGGDGLAFLDVEVAADVGEGVAEEGAALGGYDDILGGFGDVDIVEPADGEKCDRCWMFVTDAIFDGEGEERGCLCPRCHKVVFGE